jgi:pimeloyl-ACP methyl ester carboxylesterase
MEALRNILPRRISPAWFISKARSWVKKVLLRRSVGSNRHAHGRPKLEVISAGPPWGYKGAAIVFVHGAFGGAWMWEEHFLGYFGRSRRRAYAVSLQGHGKSEGRQELEAASFSDYIEDIRNFITKLGAPPVAVGHSLGGLIVQRLIDRVPLRGIVLMASAPPEGISMVGTGLMTTGLAMIIDNFQRTLPGKAHSRIDVWRHALFSDALPAKRVAQFASRMGPESLRALSEARIPGLIVSARSAKIPALVLSADADVIIKHAMARRTMHYHGATFRKVAGSGHAMMLDVKWKEAAKLIRQWLDERKI